MTNDWQQVLNFVITIFNFFGLSGIAGYMVRLWWKNKQSSHINAYSLTLQQNQRMSKDYWDRLERDAQKLERLERRENDLSSQVIAMSNQISDLGEDFEQVIKERDSLIIKNDDLTKRYNEDLQKLRDCIKRQDETIAKQSQRIREQGDVIAKQANKIKKLEKALTIWGRLIKSLPQDDEAIRGVIDELNEINIKW